MFDHLKARYDWRPIPGCPGRYVFAQGITARTIQELTEDRFEVSEENLKGARDPVSYCFFPGGGIISYRKKDGYLHTLCNTDGMTRKMMSLRSGKHL